MSHPTKIKPFARYLVAYADASSDDQTEELSAEVTEDSLVIPENLSELSDEDLQALAEQADSAFDAIYGDGSGQFSDDDIATLSTLTEGIEALSTEVAAREAKAGERAAAAAELASRARPTLAAETDKEEDEAEATAEDDSDEEDEEDAAESSAETIAASGRGAIRVPLSTVRGRRTPAARSSDAPKGVRDLASAGDVPGFAAGAPMDFMDMGKAINQRMQGFNSGAYAAAAKSGRHLREQNQVAMIRKAIPDTHMIKNNDQTHVAEVLALATNESLLPQGSLVASGGWCAPSQTTYDLLELESRDGLISLPEVGITRGGISFTRGPKFSDIYDAVGFTYTEQEDIDGDYNGEGGGSKPCYHVECPNFDDVRLQVAGLCITAGLLQARGYPEVIARTIRGALTAHEHKMTSRVINSMVSGSDAVTMPSDPLGAVAPLLTGIELQVEHYRYVHRLPRAATLEAVFPFWVRGVIRSDLSRRLGVDMLSVPDSRIDGWFRERGIAAQFVYNYQDITGNASAFTGWASEVKFLLYAAGTWVRGTSDVITLDTLYDSVLLGTNDYTALFTEEGWLTLKAGWDSREVTVPLCGNGATAGGVLVECDGTVSTVAG